MIARQPSGTWSHSPPRGSSGYGGATSPPLGTVTALQEDQFGFTFATDYRAGANGEPASVADGDIVPVSLTAEPVAVN